MLKHFDEILIRKRKARRLPRLASLPGLVWMELSGAIHPTIAQTLAGDEAVRARLMAMFDKPDQPLQVVSVATGGTHAVAGWRQGERGGRALLRRDAGAWIVVQCSGDPLREAENLRSIGVSPEEAATLAEGLARAEENLQPETLRLLSSFEGTMEMTAPRHTPSSAPVGGHHH